MLQCHVYAIKELHYILHHNMMCSLQAKSSYHSIYTIYVCVFFNASVYFVCMSLFYSHNKDTFPSYCHEIFNVDILSK